MLITTRFFVKFLMKLERRRNCDYYLLLCELQEAPSRGFSASTPLFKKLMKFSAILRARTMKRLNRLENITEKH